MGEFLVVVNYMEYIYGLLDSVLFIVFCFLFVCLFVFVYGSIDVHSLLCPVLKELDSGNRLFTELS